LPDLTAGLEPIPSRHHDVENEKGGPLPFRFHDHGVARRKYFDHESRALQVMAHQSRDIRIVLNHKDAWFHTGIVAGPSQYCPDCNQIETFQCRADSCLLPKKDATLAPNQDNHTPTFVQPKLRSRRHNRRRAVFRDDCRTRILPARLQ